DEVASARAKEQALTDALAQLEARATSDGRARVELQSLEQGVDLDRRLYEAQLARVKAADSAASAAAARLSSQASVPMIAEFPKPPLMAVLGFSSSLMIALFAVYATEQADGRLRTPDDVREALGLPTLGLVPQLTRRALRQAPAHDWVID